MTSKSVQNPQSYVADFLIVGAGIVGLTLAYELKKRYTDSRILVLEKENGLGYHASGRNSGVLHAGIYYPEGTLKAQICREGAQLLSQYCEAQGLSIKKVGKVIVPSKDTDAPQLDLLFARAARNGVNVEYIDEKTLSLIEPEARSATGRALWSPDTAVFNPQTILTRLYEELIAKGVEVCLNAQVEAVDEVSGIVKTQYHRYSFGYLFNTAGLQADLIAKSCGVGQQYAVLPFKGFYYRLDSKARLDIRHHIYPVPDLNMPFLGVHFTHSHSGEIYLGPTAVPALGRENYLGLQDIDWKEAPAIISHLIGLYWANSLNFRRYSQEECMRFFKPLFVQAAQALVPRIQERHLLSCNKVGIRPQLLDRNDKTLVMDFQVAQGERSTHVLNAISPAFTCSFAFAKFILDKYCVWLGTECKKIDAVER